MSVIENIDVVMGVQTQQLDAGIAKEIALLKNMGDSINGLSGSAAAFTPVGSMLSATVAGFARNIPGVATAMNVFKEASSAISTARTKSANEELAKSLKKVQDEAREARKEIDRLHDRKNPGKIPIPYEKHQPERIPIPQRGNGEGRADDLMPIDKLKVGGIALAAGVASAAMAGLAYSAYQVHQQMTVIDDMSDSAKKLSMSFTELSTARLSLSQTSGLDAGGVDMGLQRMTLGLSEANATGQGAVFDSMSALGLNAGELLKKGPLEAFKEISIATQQLKNPTDQLAVSYELFGKSGAALVNSLREGPGEIERMNILAGKLGMNLSNAQAEQVGAANDAWSEMGMIATGAYRQIAAEVAPVIQVIAESITKAGTDFAGWQEYITGTVDGAVYFAGVLYDIGELSSLTYRTLNNIYTMNWNQVGEDFTSAFDFGTGQASLDKVLKAREDAANKAAKEVGRPDSESAIAQYEREKKLKEEELSLKKAAAAEDRKAIEAKERAAEAFQKQLQDMRDQNAVLKEANALRAKGLTVNEQDLALRMKLAKEADERKGDALKNVFQGNFSGAFGDISKSFQSISGYLSVIQLQGERQQQEQVRDDINRAAQLKKEAASPQDNLKEAIRDLMRLRSEGRIDQRTFDASAKKAAASTIKDTPVGAVSAQAGSVEAYKLQLNRENEAAKLAREDKVIQESILEVLRETNSKIGNQSNVRRYR